MSDYPRHELAGIDRRQARRRTRKHRRIAARRHVKRERNT